MNTNCGAVDGRVSSKHKKIFGSNQNKPKQNLFRLCLDLFRATKKLWFVLVSFGLFRFVSVFRSKQPKQTEIFLKLPKSPLYQNVSVGLLFVSVQSKQTNSLFHYRSKTTETNCFETNRNNPKFSEKYQNMFSIKLFWLVFCLFQFNLNTETRCFG